MTKKTGSYSGIDGPRWKKLRSKIRKIQKKNKELEAEAEAQEAYEFATFLYTIGYICILIWLWWSKFGQVFQTSQPDKINNGIAEVIQIISLGQADARWPTVFVILAILIFSNIRIVAGSLLCNSENSDLRKNVIKRQDHKSSLRILFILIKLIAIASLVRLYSFGSTYYFVMPLCMFFESLLIIKFDNIFYNEITKTKDGEKSEAGLLIIKNDNIFFWTSFLWLLVIGLNYVVKDFYLDFKSSFPQAYWGAALFYAYLWIMAAVAHVILFFKEINGYKEQFAELLKSINDAIKLIKPDWKGFLNKISHFLTSMLRWINFKLRVIWDNTIKFCINILRFIFNFCLLVLWLCLKLLFIKIPLGPNQKS